MRNVARCSTAVNGVFAALSLSDVSHYGVILLFCFVDRVERIKSRRHGTFPFPNKHNIPFLFDPSPSPKQHPTHSNTQHPTNSLSLGLRYVMVFQREYAESLGELQWKCVEFAPAGDTDQLF